MGKRSNWKEFEAILSQNRITKLYHFTDRDNLESIIKNGGLYSWKDCEERGISIPKPGCGVDDRFVECEYRIFLVQQVFGNLFDVRI